MAQHWDFPPDLVTGMRCCAQPLTQGDFSRLAGVLNPAVGLADGGALTPDNVEQLPGLLMQLLGLETPSLLTNPPAEGDLDTRFFD